MNVCVWGEGVCVCFSTITRKFLSVEMRDYNILFSLIITLFDFGMFDFGHCVIKVKVVRGNYKFSIQTVIIFYS